MKPQGTFIYIIRKDVLIYYRQDAYLSTLKNQDIEWQTGPSMKNVKLKCGYSQYKGTIYKIRIRRYGNGDISGIPLIEPIQVQKFCFDQWADDIVSELVSEYRVKYLIDGNHVPLTPNLRISSLSCPRLEKVPSDLFGKLDDNLELRSSVSVCRQLESKVSTFRLIPCAVNENITKQFVFDTFDMSEICYHREYTVVPKFRVLKVMTNIGFVNKDDYLLDNVCEEIHYRVFNRWCIPGVGCDPTVLGKYGIKRVVLSKMSHFTTQPQHPDVVVKVGNTFIFGKKHATLIELADRGEL
jgi:hypothetical protein